MRVVFQEQVENGAHLVADTLVLEWDQHFDTVVEIARHQVGAPDQYPLVFPTLEAKYPRVLEKTSENADNPDTV